MLTLHGFAISNYYNMVRMALEHKGAEYRCAQTYPNQKPEFLALSPMGKVPCLETDDGALAETSVILEYINETVDGPSLLPADAWARAQARQMIHTIELYLELPARRLYSGVYFGGVNEQHTIDEVKPVLEKGVAALAKLARFAPWMAGEEIGSVDYFAYYTFDLACGVAQQTYGMDMLSAIPGATEWKAKMEALPAVQRFNAQKAAEMDAFIAMIKAKSTGK